jgi:hypothetical protein
MLASDPFMDPTAGISTLKKTHKRPPVILKSERSFKNPEKFGSGFLHHDQLSVPVTGKQI